MVITKIKYLFEAPVGFKIQMNFSKLFLISCDKYSTFGPCDKDWLEVKEDPKFFFKGGPRL